MATLTGNSVASSYPGLIKFDDNGAVQPTTLKALSDGTGGSLPLSLSQVETKFTSGTVVDFTGVTVNGLPGGGTPGLIAGSGATSIESDLGTNANASGSTSIALGSASVASSTWAIAMGVDAQATNGQGAVAISTSAYSRATRGIAIGQQAETTTGTSDGISIGYLSKARATDSITIGQGAIVDDAVRVNTVVIGKDAKAAQYSTAIGADAQAVGAYTIAVGDAFCFQNYAIAIGDLASAGAAVGVVALGRNVNAIGWQDSTTVNQMAFQNYAGLNFADDAAAATGGVPLGGIFHTNGALKIRYTL